MYNRAITCKYSILKTLHSNTAVLPRGHHPCLLGIRGTILTERLVLITSRALHDFLSLRNKIRRPQDCESSSIRHPIHFNTWARGKPASPSPILLPQAILTEDRAPGLPVTLCLEPVLHPTLCLNARAGIHVSWSFLPTS